MGELERNNKIGFAVNQTSKVLWRTTLDIALSPLPSVFSNVIKEMLNFYPKFKQETLSEFYLSFFNHLEQSSGYKIDKLNFTNDDFLTVLMSISDKIIMTKSKLKLECFKNILLNQLRNPIEDQYSQKFTSLVEDLNEIQLFVLNEMSKTIPLRSISDICFLIDKEVSQEKLKEVDYPITINFGFQKVKTDLSEMDFNLKGLITLGFINYDDNARLNNQRVHLLPAKEGQKQCLDDCYYISKFGDRFLKFIMESG